jgi:hypothetical protein
MRARDLTEDGGSGREAMLRLYITVASLVRRIDSRLQSSKTKAGCSLDHYIHLTVCESVTVAKAPRGKETRASCSSAKSILAPPRQVSEARKPYNAELKTCVTSVQYSVSETIRSPATLPLYRPWLQRCIRVPTMDGSLSPNPQSPSLALIIYLSFSLPSRNREAPASVPRQTPSYGRTVASTCHSSRTTVHVPFPPSFALTVPCIRRDHYYGLRIINS